MNISKIISIFLLILISTINLYPQAQNVCDSGYFGSGSPSIGGQSICNGRATKNTPVKDQVIAIVDSINRTLVFIVPMVAIIALLIGAFLIMQEGLQVGIVIIQWALIGMVVVLLSYGLVSSVVLFFI